MTVWIDGDSCPKQVRDIVNSRCVREKIALHYVANSPLPLPDSSYITMSLTSDAPDSADDFIVQNSRPGDLVLTRDIPLASALVKKQMVVMNDRGNLFTKDNVSERLSQRDFMQMMREAGIGQDKGKNYGPKEIKAFSSCFDRELVRMLREERFRKAAGTR
ncbi:DUF188 domain-containing protein [Oceanispirochaeta sp.]|jgi:uncharacterized protein YaiI (UPF0178 family)|uniref:YaiI/YqxD family protein n=1 Tax=Oceanispirochaeta sp. TaxID=2035350 RepID=UPI0026398D83|nr:DUF188 domain-containing protein [Oceanispirochaeta sp.]MDA3955680.1 DUF188 domain-containing protein [Oceanispirochaeta sp.]